MKATQFEIEGQARPAGSKRGFAVKKAGKFTGKTVVVDTSGAAGRDWRALIQDRAHAAFGDYKITGAVALYVEFQIQRPKGHYGSGKNAGIVLPKFRHKAHTSKPDATKLLRALEDALTGIAWDDDSQVTLQVVKKYYGDTHKTMVRVEG
jgi:Holliday junction resolvase RusA-like endonuclease